METVQCYCTQCKVEDTRQEMGEENYGRFTVLFEMFQRFAVSVPYLCPSGNTRTDEKPSVVELNLSPEFSNQLNRFRSGSNESH